MGSFPQQVLKNAFTHVPRYGFSLDALKAGTPSLNSMTASQLFPNGASGALFKAWSDEQCRVIESVGATAIQPDESKANPATATATSAQALKHRLSLNVPVLGHLADGLATLPIPNGYVGHTFNVADSVCYASNLQTEGADWYKARAHYASVYAASELFLLSDKSTSQADTYELVDRMIKSTNAISQVLDNTKEFSSYALSSIPTILKNLYLNPGTR